MVMKKAAILIASLLLSLAAGAQQNNSTGGTIVISGEELCRYSTGDIRNTLAGIVAGLEIVENYGGPGVSALEHTNQYGATPKVSSRLRGGNVVWLLDGVPVQMGETPLEVEQIESVTIVKDVLDKAAYGATGAAGVVSIKTKHGPDGKSHNVNVTAEFGVNITDRMPQFANAEQYARVNNYARANSGLTPLYTKEDVAGYARGDAASFRYPSVDWRALTLKKAMPYGKVNFSTNGSNGKNTKYFVSLGYLGQDDIFKCGAKSGYNRISINANVDVALHKYIDVSFGFLSSYTIRTSPNYWTSTYAEDFMGLISDLVKIPSTAFPVYLDKGSEIPSYAVGTTYTRNPVAGLTGNGSYTETTRKGLMDIALDVDFSFLTPGLKSRTYGAFDVVNLVRIGKSEDYAAYVLTPVENLLGEVEMVPSLSSAHTYRSVSDKSNLLDYYANRYFVSETLTYDRTFGRNAVSCLADFVLTQRNQKFITEHRRWIDIDLSAQDVIDDKITVKAALNLHGTYSLLKKWSLSPTVGIGWKVIPQVKLRAQLGYLSYDPLADANREVDNYTWGSAGYAFGPYSSGQWFGSGKSSGAYRTYISRISNPNLRLERRHEINAGVDARVLQDRLDASFTFYSVYVDGTPTSMVNSIPAMAGNSSASLFMNYNSSQRTGFELSLGWHDKAGDFSYSARGWAASNFSRISKIDEIQYPESYRSKIGRSESAIWGLRCTGAKDGNLTFVDMNGDGEIDDTDMCVIGDSSPKLIYGLTLIAKYRSFDLSLVASGRAFCDILCNNAYFQNGWGTDNYSLYTLQHLYDESSPMVRYDKETNNFKTSSHWLAGGGFFKIQSLELGWTAKKYVRVYVRANNLATISKLKGVDPEAVDSGITNYPLMRTVVGGVKLAF